MARSKNSQPDGATSWKDTKRGIIPRHELVPLEALGVARGLALVLNTAAKKRIRITTAFILNLHKRCFGDLFDWAGKWRRINVQISHHTPPQYYELPVLMHNFVEDLNVRLSHVTPKTTDHEQRIKNVVEIVVWSQHRFLWIHPFQDYNGRIARLLSNLILAHYRLPMIRIDFNDKTIRSRYIQALQSADNYDYAPLTEVIINMLECEDEERLQPKFTQGLNQSLKEAEKGNMRQINSLRDL